MNLLKTIYRETLITFILLVAIPVVVITDIIMGKKYSVNLALAVDSIRYGLTTEQDMDNEDESTN